MERRFLARPATEVLAFRSQLVSSQRYRGGLAPARQGPYSAYNSGGVMALLNPDGKRTAFTDVRGGRAREGDWFQHPVAVCLAMSIVPVFDRVGEVSAHRKSIRSVADPPPSAEFEVVKGLADRLFEGAGAVDDEPIVRAEARTRRRCAVPRPTSAT